MTAIDRRYVQRIKGRDFVVFAGLLEMAHQEGLNNIETELVQCPSEENAHTAIARAKVRTERGSFTGIGDASPANVKTHIQPHLIRMAETRAIVRALRWATNVGQAAVEELCEVEGVDEAGPTTAQLSRIKELMQSPDLSAEDLDAVERALPQLTVAKADDIITILEAKAELTSTIEIEGAWPSGESEKRSSGNPATSKQRDLLEKTLAEHEGLLTDQEKVQLQALLDGELTKEQASDGLDYLLGRSVKNPATGVWEKVSRGILADRRAADKAA